MYERRADIEVTKGLAILLVVFGHLVARQDPAGVYWYEPLRRAVYAFHMPLFLYLSGLVAVHSGFLRRPRTALPGLAAARARRLLVPFFAMGLLIVLGKCAAAGMLHVDNPPASLGAGLLALVWDTGCSPALSIWYLFVLFMVSLAAVAVLDGRMARLPWLLAASLIMFWLPLPALVYLDRIFTFAPFFLMGAAAGWQTARWDSFMDRAWPWLLLVFGLCLVPSAWVNPPPGMEQKAILLVVGSISLPAIHGGLRRLRCSPLQNILLLLGRYSFMIYLFNTLCIGLAKGLLLLVWPWDGVNFPPFAGALLCAGLAGPMMLKRCVLHPIKRLHRAAD